MGRITTMTCDAPDCGTEVSSTEVIPWFVAIVNVHQPVNDEEPPVGWHWHSDGVQVEACSRECLRIALALKIAEMTEEPACP